MALAPYRRFFHGRVGAVLALVALACCAPGCPADGPAETSSRPPVGRASDELLVHVTLSAGALRVVSVSPVAHADDAPAAPEGATLAYSFSDTTGALLANGRVADPRPVFVEWSEGGVSRRAEGSAPASSVVLRLPSRSGVLTLFTDGPTGPVPVGRVEVAPPRTAAPPGTAVDTLLNPDTDIVGAPVKVVDHGTAERNFDLLFLPEGYTREQLALFAADVQRVVSELASRADWSRHWAQINVWRIDVASAAAGVSDAPPAALHNTAFGLRRDVTTDRLIVSSDGRGMAAATELGARVSADRIIIVANTRYGGSGGRIAVAANDDSLPGVVAHELGHSLFHLADEYFDATSPERSDAECAATPASNPNASSSADRASIPWADLIAASTALPTTSSSAGPVGAYLGGDRCRTSRYRPTPHCLMGPNLHDVFCPVCQREMDHFFERFPGGPASMPMTSPPPDAGVVTPPADAGSGTGAMDASVVARDAASPTPAGPSCEYTCARVGYTAGQCNEGWYCDGECVSYTGCTAAAPPPSTDAGVAPSCTYTCAAYGYASGQCVDGYYCDGECIVFNGCL